MATILIRNANQNEKDDILKSVKGLVDEVENKDNPNLKHIEDTLRNGVNQRLTDFKAVLYDKELAGFFHLGNKDENTIEVFFLYVFPNSRKKHIGSQILEHAVIQASNRNKVLQISVTSNNKYGIKFLTEFGFNKVESSKDPNFILFEVDTRNRFN